jgi:hypothetical protein
MFRFRSLFRVPHFTGESLSYGGWRIIGRNCLGGCLFHWARRIIDRDFLNPRPFDPFIGSLFSGSFFRGAFFSGNFFSGNFFRGAFFSGNIFSDYKTARRRLRNEQDDAKENSEKLRDELNEKWSASQRLSKSKTKPTRTRMIIMTMAIFYLPGFRVYKPRLQTTKIATVTTITTKKTAGTNRVLNY